MTIKGYCKYTENLPLLEFGNDSRFFNGTRCGSVYRSTIRKQFTDSIEILVERNTGVNTPIAEFKLTNQGLVTWDDYWIDSESDTIVDPKIQRLNLQRNNLVYVNINTPRLELMDLNLEGNTTLVHLYLHEVPKLEILNLSGCTGLNYISLGINRSIQNLIVKDCFMTESTMEQLLRDFTPTVCKSANLRGVGAFRKQHNTLLDLRGNNVVWDNRRIASKIRLLLNNNWVVKWDNNPPPEVIPPQMYGFFVESLLGK